MTLSTVIVDFLLIVFIPTFKWEFSCTENCSMESFIDISDTSGQIVFANVRVGIFSIFKSRGKLLPGFQKKRHIYTFYT